MTGDEIFLIDTNVLIYYYDAADQRKHRIAKNIIDDCWNNERNIVVSAQTLSEFFSIVTKKKFLSGKDAIRVISDIIEFDGWIKISFSHETVLDAAKISEEAGMPYWDSLLAATMKHNLVFNIYTENKKDFKTPWLNAQNPFEK